MPPAISIVIPAYNDEARLPGLLEEISRTRCRAYEVIIVDDCSAVPVSVYLPTSDNICVHRLEKNRGASRARNEGVSRSSGDIIIFMDTDISLPEETDVIGCISDIFREHPDIDCVSTFTHIQPLRKNSVAYNNSVYQNYYFDRILGGEDSYIGRLLLFTTRLGAIRREIFIRSGGFNESLGKMKNEDGEFWTRLFSMGARSYLGRELYHYHEYPVGFFSFASNYFLAARAQFLIDRAFKAPDDKSISLSEKVRRICAVMVLPFWGLSFYLPGISRAAAVPVSAAVFFLLMSGLNRYVWRYVPVRFRPGWYMAYVAVSYFIIAGYIAGAADYLLGRRIEKNRPSDMDIFAGRTPEIS